MNPFRVELALGLVLLAATAVFSADPNFCAGKSDGMHGDPQDCQAFYDCVHGITKPTRCSGSLQYNPATKSCDNPNQVNCTGGGGGSQTSRPTQPTRRPTDGRTSRPTPRPTLPPSSGGRCDRVVCYFVNWGVNRKGAAKQVPSDIDARLCTHLIYSFSRLYGNQMVDTRPGIDTNNYKTIVAKKRDNPSLKVMTAIGGWAQASMPFTNMVRTQQDRQEFINSVIKYLRDRNLDGLDLDWEYPTRRGSPPADRANFVSLVKELRAAFEAEAQRTRKDRLLVSAAVAAGKKVIESSYDIPALNRELDFINLMAYGLHGSWESKTGHNSPLYKHRNETGNHAYLNVAAAVDVWLNGGTDSNKLVLGLPLYGKTFNLRSTSDTGLMAPATGAASSGPYTGTNGLLSYYEICTLLDKPGVKNMTDPDQQVPYLVDGKVWVSYDDEASLRRKVQYLKKKRLGGAMVWDLSLDDFSGTFCHKGKYPLLNAINRECGR